MTIKVQIHHHWDGFSLNAAFESPRGITAIFGRSGSGKTSIINAISGIFTPDHAKISIDQTDLVNTQAGINIPIHNRGVGYIFQHARLFPHLSVMNNLRYSAKYGRRKSHRFDPTEIIDLLGIEHILDRRPAALSGGEQQRVAIARALLSDPKILLMDEPLSALDAQRKAEILPFLERIRDNIRIPILYVSHSMSEVARLANHIVILDAGKVVASGDARQILADPALVPYLGVRSAGSSILTTLKAHDDDGLTRLATSSGNLYLPTIRGTVGQQVRVRILAQDVTIALTRPGDISALNILPCVVGDIHMGEGPGAIVSLRSGDDVFLARITRRSVQHLGLAIGKKCHAVIKSVSVSPTEIG